MSYGGIKMSSMMSLVDACGGCLSRALPSFAPPARPLLRLLAARPGGWHVQQGRMHAAGAAASAPAPRRLAALAAQASPPAAEDFFATGAVTFKSLGLGAEVCAALQAAGFHRPAHAQELAVPEVLAGQDAVLAAETGSGKTLAYLAPLAELALRSRQRASAQQQQQQQAPASAAAAAAAAAASTQAPARTSSSSFGGRQQGQGQQGARPRRPTAALVLCPNAALCEQVVAAAQSLKDPASGQPLVDAFLLTSQAAPPESLPDVVVTTPGALVSLMDGSGTIYGLEWTRAGLAGWARHVVFDEADLLLSGGYGAQMRIIWDLLRAGDRLHAARRICLQVGLTEDEFAELPRHLKQAAKLGGAEGLLEAGLRPRPGRSGSGSSPSSGGNGGGPAGEEEEEGEGDDFWKDFEQEDAEESSNHARGVHGPSWRRQYVFVAATMPAEGERSVGAEIAARFPEAAWLAGRQLHQSKRAVEHAWRRVEVPEERAAALREVVAGDADLSAGRGRMLVFARDVASAEATAAVLQEAGLDVPILQYHKGVPAAERAAALARMGGSGSGSSDDGEEAGVEDGGLVMVCTDAAARGLDVPDISHVVQADFAQSAVDFLHRVGRTARAGKAGRVTSLYAPEAEPLVEAIRDNIAAGQPVEGAFSRKRSFRKKLRKYGSYVPRGQEGPREAQQQRRQERDQRREQRRSREWR